MLNQRPLITQSGSAAAKDLTADYVDPAAAGRIWNLRDEVLKK
jgi:hypothetical protein